MDAFPACRRGALVLLALVASETAHAQQQTTPPPEASARVVAGSADSYTGGFNLRWRGMTLAVPFAIGARVEQVSDFAVDRAGAGLDADAAGNLQARVGVKLSTQRALLPFNLAAEYEHDLITGPVSGAPRLAGEGLPSSGEVEHQLRKAYGRVSLGYYLHLIGGWMTSHWGLGLVANDGDHGWEPGLAMPADPRGGDRVVRVMLASGPVTRLALQAAVGFDWVRQDDAMLPGDSARQLVGSFTIGARQPTSLGFYGVWRRQTAQSGGDHEVAVVDLYAATRQRLRRRLELHLAFEGAIIVGSTSLAATPDFRRRDVLQLGAALRGGLDLGRAGLSLDVLYASGDGALDDGQQTNFKADPNFELGLLTYRYLYAAHTGRGVTAASDPALVARPSLDIERFPTRGAVTNTVALFPRLWWRPTPGLETYGGPLFAFAATANADPLATREAGGAPRNAFGAEAGSYLGTEFDLGARLRLLLAGTELTLSAEGAVLLPGSAFQKSDGRRLDPIVGGRGALRYRF